MPKPKKNDGVSYQPYQSRSFAIIGDAEPIPVRDPMVPKSKPKFTWARPLKRKISLNPIVGTIRQRFDIFDFLRC